MPRPCRTAWIVFALALVARFAFFAAGPSRDPARATAEDSTLYVELASRLVSDHVFAVPASHQTGMHAFLNSLAVAQPGQSGDQLVAETFRTPGYPAFIAVASASLWDIRLVLVAQCLLGAVAAVLVMLTASGLGLRGVIVTGAGLVWALHPALILADNSLLSESTFLFCVVSAHFLAVSARTPSSLLVGAVLLGVATLIRPPFGLAFVPSIILLSWHRLLPKAGVIAAVCLVAATPPALWAVRNWSIGERLAVSTVADFALVFYTAPCAVSESRGEDCDESYALRREELAQRLRAKASPDDDMLVLARGFALQDLRTHASGALRMYAKSIVKLAISHSAGWWATGLGRTYRPTSLFSALIQGDRSRVSSMPSLGAVAFPLAWVLFNLLLAALSVVGLLGLLIRRDWSRALALGLPILALFVAIGAVGQERMRIPIMLSMVLLAGFGCTLGRAGPAQPGLARTAGLPRAAVSGNRIERSFEGEE